MLIDLMKKRRFMFGTILDSLPVSDVNLQQIIEAQERLYWTDHAHLIVVQNVLLERYQNRNTIFNSSGSAG